MNTTLQRNRKATQRQRLQDAMLAIAAEDGYATASIAQVIARAGVSRPTFYEYFAERDACFLAALDDAGARLLARVRRAVEDQPPEHALTVALASLVPFAQAEPAMARVLFGEAMAAGHRALELRDETLLQLEQMIEYALERAPSCSVAPDLAPRIVLGASFRMLGYRLRRDRQRLDEAQSELQRWLESYDRPVGEHRWRTLSPEASAPAAWPAAVNGTLRPPSPPSHRRARASHAQIAQQSRRAVLLALAELAAEDGYATVTIRRIAERAGIESRAFYRLFDSKQQAFTALTEMYFQQTMALTAGAFFTRAPWPRRVLAAILTLAACVEQNPALARACFIESYASERGAPQRVEQLTRAFTLFLTEGDRYAGRVTPHPRGTLEAIAHANFELIYQQARASATPRIAGVLGHSVHLCLAPFIGGQAAGELIDQELQRPGDTPTPTSVAGEQPRRTRRRRVRAAARC